MPRGCWRLTHAAFCLPRSEITPEGKREVKLDQVLLNGNNVCMVRPVRVPLLLSSSLTPLAA